MDLTTDSGFVGALYQCCRLTPGSGWLAAPVCSSFVYMWLSNEQVKHTYKDITLFLHIYMYMFVFGKRYPRRIVIQHV